MNSLDSYSSTSTGQKRDRSLKLSRYIDSCEERNKPVLENQIPTSRTVPQRDENGGKNLFTGAVFNNCQFTFTAADAGYAIDHAAIPVKKLKRILPLMDSADEL